jgi:hypothetical protein
VKAKNNWLLLLLMAVLALTRWPALWPESLQNFSAVYAMAFCAGVYFQGRAAWWIPLATLALTDVGLNCYYYFSLGINGFQPALLFNYVAYLLIIWLGCAFKPLTQSPSASGTRRRIAALLQHTASWLALIGGGILGAVVFYLITNTAAWWFNPFHNPEYTKTWAGFVIALTKGTAGWPHTWEFFRNTLMSGGLFTALFVGAAKLSSVSEPDPESKQAAEDKPEEVEAEPEKSGA